MNLTRLFRCAILAGLLMAAGCAAPPEDIPPAHVGISELLRAPRPAQSPTSPPPSRPSTPPPETTVSFRDIAAAQVVLDRANLSPGVIDGIMGPRTHSALRAWQEQRGIPAAGELDDTTRAAMNPEETLFTTHIVSDQDHERLAPVPSTWRGRSNVEYLGYETVLERVAELYHTSQALLRRLNPDAPWPNPPTGTVLAVPNPRPFRTPHAASLHVSLSRKTIWVHDAEANVVALFPCSIGRSTMQSPTGEMTVVAAAENPNYYFDPRVFPEDEEAQKMTGKLVIPPGPNNPVGIAWISLSRSGYGIHGTPHPEDIGKTESHGCIRLANWNAEKLVKMISVGVPVIIEE